jgi:hypothetical protein
MSSKAEVAIIVVSILIAAPIFFVALLGFISFILSAGGWRRLARQYAAPAGASGSTNSRLVGMVGTSTYKGAIKVTTTSSGLQIQASPALYVGHPPLFIPFGAIRNPKKAQKFHNKPYATFEVGEPRPVQLALPAEVFNGTPVELR